MWKTIKGEEIADLEKFLRDEAGEGIEVHIGTDSLPASRGPFKKYTQFCTVIAILKPHGARALYRRSKVPRIESLHTRLQEETWRSLELALEIQPQIKGPLTIHIDANPVVIHKSSKYVNELVGMVVGSGFKALIKPDAWAATHAADFVVRHLGKLPADL